MTAIAKTIHELLPNTRGDQAALARLLGCNRGTIAKYLKDRAGEHHAVVNGQLMVATGCRGKNRWGGQ